MVLLMVLTMTKMMVLLMVLMITKNDDFANEVDERRL